MADCPFNPAAENVADLIYRFGSLQYEKWVNAPSICMDSVSYTHLTLPTTERV